MKKKTREEDRKKKPPCTTNVLHLKQPEDGEAVPPVEGICVTLEAMLSGKAPAFKGSSEAPPLKRQPLPSHGLLSVYDKQFKLADKRHGPPSPTLTTITIATAAAATVQELLQEVL